MSDEVEQAVAVLRHTHDGQAWLQDVIGEAGAKGWNECVDHIATTVGYGWQDRFKNENPYKEALEKRRLEEPSIPSRYEHLLYSVKHWTTTYDSGETREYTTDLKKADVVASEIVASILGLHTIMLDIDMPAWLIPSSTPGHSHLYIDRVLSWRAYRRLLKALSRAGVIEPGYYKASCKRRHTSLRVPGHKKGAS